MSNENVLYQSAAKASQAFEEIRRAVTTCPAGKFLPPQVAGEPPLKYALRFVADDQLGDVAPEHVALEGTIRDQAGRSQPVCEVFQRRGLVMAAMYGPDLVTIKPYLPILAQRLAALATAEAGE